MDKKLILATLLALFLVPFLAIGRAEIVSGEDAVSYTGAIIIYVPFYIEVDFGPGWRELRPRVNDIIGGPIFPGTSGYYEIFFNFIETYVEVRSNTNTNVDIVFGIPQNEVFINNITIDGKTAVKGWGYRVWIENIQPGTKVTPQSIYAGIYVPPQTPPGGYIGSFILCVVIPECYYFCPAL